MSVQKKTTYAIPRRSWSLFAVDHLENCQGGVGVVIGEEVREKSA